MGKFCQRIGLVHELGQLGAAKELSYCCDNGPDVYKSSGSCGSWIDLSSHTLFYYPLHTKEPYSKLVLDKLTDGSDPPIAQVVNVIGGKLSVVDTNHGLYQG